MSCQVEGTALDLRQASLVAPGHQLNPPLPLAQALAIEPPRATPPGKGAAGGGSAVKGADGRGKSGKRRQAVQSGGKAAAEVAPEPAAKRRKTEAANGAPRLAY